MKRLIRAMRDHDANEETHYLREGRIAVAWSWPWFDWLFGISVHGDPAELPGAWLYLGPLTIGAYYENRGA